MFKMQISIQKDNHNWKQNVATDKKVYSEKNRLKFQNPKFNISCKIAYIFLS